MPQNRHLFSFNQLGIDKYEKARRTVERKAMDKQFLMNRMRKSALNPNYDLQRIETDLKNFIHLMNATDNDFVVLKTNLCKLVEKRNDYQGCNETITNIGSMILRMFYHLKMPNQAFEVKFAIIKVYSIIYEIAFSVFQ